MAAPHGKKVPATADEYLESIYFDPAQPGSYGGIHKLWDIVKQSNVHKLKFKQVQEWLKNQDTYSRHRPAKVIFPRQKIWMSRMDQQWDADLMDVSKFSRVNKGYKYLAVFIDIFSRYIWVEPMKTKRPAEMVRVLKRVFSEGRKPEYMRTDKGSEFIGGVVSRYLDLKRVHHFTAVNAIHASYAERVIRTLKGKLYRFFTRNQSYKYIAHLDDIVDSYLDTVHRTLGMRPVDITVTNQQKIYEKLYLPHQLEEAATPVTFLFNVGAKVRISIARTAFTKAYKDTFTEEVFKIKFRTRTHPPRYKLEDLLGETIAGTFYEPELQKVLHTAETYYNVEKVLRYRTRNKVREGLVRWQGYSPQFDSWEPVTAIKGYK